MAFRVTTAEVEYDASKYPLHSNPSLEVTKGYSNYTGTIVYLKNQANFTTPLMPGNIRASSVPFPHVEIKTTYVIYGAKNIVETRTLLEDLEANNALTSLESKWLLDSIYEQSRKNSSYLKMPKFEFCCFHHIASEEIHDADELYIRESDVVLSFNRKTVKNLHPNANSSLNQTMLERNKELHGFCGVFVRVTDNERQTPSFFYYAGKRVVEVPTVVNPSERSGVYITHCGKKENNFASTTEFMSFEEAEEAIGLYRTKDEALSNGDPGEAIKVEMARLKVMEQEAERANALLKQEHDREKLLAQRELEMARHANAQLKEALDIANQRRDFEYETQKQHRDFAYKSQEQQRDLTYEDRREYRDDYYDRRKKERSDYYEEKSAGMKLAAEIMKYLPAVIIGGISVFAVLNARKTT